jgi:hypothetical protein
LGRSDQRVYGTGSKRRSVGDFSALTLFFRFSGGCRPRGGSGPGSGLRSRGWLRSRRGSRTGSGLRSRGWLRARRGSSLWSRTGKRRRLVLLLRSSGWLGSSWLLGSSYRDCLRAGLRNGPRFRSGLRPLLGYRFAFETAGRSWRRGLITLIGLSFIGSSLTGSSFGARFDRRASLRSRLRLRARRRRRCWFAIRRGDGGRGGSHGRTSTVCRGKLVAIACGFARILRLRCDRGRMALAASGDLRRSGSDVDSTAAAVIADASVVDVVRDGSRISVMRV